jgi:hypothetical protein
MEENAEARDKLAQQFCELVDAYEKEHPGCGRRAALEAIGWKVMIDPEWPDPYIPAERYRAVLCTWQMREDLWWMPRDAWLWSDDDSRVWVIEENYGLGYLEDRERLLHDTITRFDRPDDLLFELLLVRLQTLSDRAYKSTRVGFKAIDRRAAVARRQMIAGLRAALDLHHELRAGARDYERWQREHSTNRNADEARLHALAGFPTGPFVPAEPDPVPIYQAALQLLTSENPAERDRLIAPSKRRGTNPRGNPRPIEIARAHDRLKAAGIVEDDRRLLLEAIGLLPFKPENTN